MKTARSTSTRGSGGRSCSTAVVTAILGLTPTLQSDGGVKIGLAKYPERFAATAGIAMLGLLALWLIIRRWRNTRVFMRIMTAALALCA